MFILHQGFPTWDTRMGVGQGGQGWQLPPLVVERLDTYSVNIDELF